MREWINLRLFNFIWTWSEHHPNQTMPVWLRVPVKVAYDWSRRHSTWGAFDVSRL